MQVVTCNARFWLGWGNNRSRVVIDVDFLLGLGCDLERVETLVVIPTDDDLVAGAVTCFEGASSHLPVECPTCCHVLEPNKLVGGGGDEGTVLPLPVTLPGRQQGISGESYGHPCA